MTVFLYETKRKVELTLRESGGSVNWNLPMNTNDFKVFKDVFNNIEFVVRDTDRKPINMMGRSAEITLYDHRTSRSLWVQPLKVVNEARGICRLTITPDVTEDWYLQTYSYSVTVTDADQSYHMLFVDANESQRGFFQLVQGPRFDPQPSYEITAFKPEQAGADDDLHYLMSSALPGALQRGSASGLHTAVAYLNNFSGTLEIQGSVEEGSPTEEEWYVVETRTYDHQSGLDAFNFVANLNWVRFRITNRYAADEFTLDVNKGEITKLVFRN